MPLSIPEAVRTKHGIPPSATHYSFSYPLDGLRDDFDTIMSSIVGSSAHDEMEDDILMLLLLGGFVYFAFDQAASADASAAAPAAAFGSRSGDVPRVVCVNALSLSSSAPVAFYFDGPNAAPPAAVNAMRQAGRLCPVTIGRLVQAGLSEFAWVNPKEQPGGHALASSVDNYQNGAFVYTMRDGSHPASTNARSACNCDFFFSNCSIFASALSSSCRVLRGCQNRAGHTPGRIKPLARWKTDLLQIHVESSDGLIGFGEIELELAVFCLVDCLHLRSADV